MTETIRLNNGMDMPVLGFGAFRISDEDQCKSSVLDAINAGYRLIDTASIYKNEEQVGAAISTSGIKREDIFVTTKLWITDYGYEKAMKAFQHGRSVIPKSVHKDRIIENAAIFDFLLTQEEMAAMDGLDENLRVGYHPDEYDLYPYV